jgi:cell division protein FtsI (penicillin-binding protein 3)
MSIGYEVQVTPLQMAMAYAAFANEGRLMRPYVVDEVIDERGNVIQKTRPYVVRTPIKPSTIESLYPIFESVLTEQGTAEFARVEGVGIAGKTGTAQKFVDGRYQTRYRATFVGFYPTDDPKYVCLVLMDEPRTSIYGGVVSGPVFKNITQRILALDERLHRETVIPEDSLTYVVPKVEGMSRDDAFTLLDEMNFRYDHEGRGARVASQRPAAGTVIRKREEIILVMDGGDK